MFRLEDRLTYSKQDLWHLNNRRHATCSACAAHNVLCFKHTNSEALRCEQRRCHQTIVTGTHDHYICAVSAAAAAASAARKLPRAMQ